MEKEINKRKLRITITDIAAIALLIFWTLGTILIGVFVAFLLEPSYILGLGVVIMIGIVGIVCFVLPILLLILGSIFDKRINGDGKSVKFDGIITDEQRALIVEQIKNENIFKP